MSVKATNWAWNQTLKPTALLVLLRLADFAGQDGRCYASYFRLTTDVNVSKNTIIKALKELQEWGYITKIKNKRENQANATNSFILNIHIPDIDLASAETEQGLVQTVEPALVQTVEPAKKLTLKQKKEKKKKKIEPKAPQVPLEQHDKRWMAHAGTLEQEPRIPTPTDNHPHNKGCRCQFCSINRCWHVHQSNTKQQGHG